MSVEIKNTTIVMKDHKSKAIVELSKAISSLARALEYDNKPSYGIYIEAEDRIDE